MICPRSSATGAHPTLHVRSRSLPCEPRIVRLIEDSVGSPETDFAIVFCGRMENNGRRPDRTLQMPPACPTSGDFPSTGAGFQTTHWTVVLTAAAGDDGTAARDALARLCSAYWYPLYAFCRRQGCPPHDAEDLTQEFFARLLAKHGLASVRPEHGRFRSFLLACLKNFLANERERAQAQRRGGGRPLLSLDGAEAQTRYAL